MSTTPKRPDLEPEELVAEDDRAVGRGLRISVLILLALGALGGVAWIALRPPKVTGPVKVTQLKAPEVANTNVLAQIPKVPFTDVTASAGIRFRHETGAAGDKLLPETMGGGVAFVDLDGDTAP
ncbi:MAG: hypothetical protein ACO3I0_00035 [Limisphaerales bacterium]